MEKRIKDLNKESEMIFGLDPEHYPWFSVHRKNGKFSFVMNDYTEFGMGYDPVHYIDIGEPFSYDCVKYYDLKPSIYSTFYRIYASDRGYIALGKNDTWNIFCLDAHCGCSDKMVDGVKNWQDAVKILDRRIGYITENWKDLSHWCLYTPNRITSLRHNQIFVFGSNLEGKHYGGAAKDALNFGAVMGQGVGIQGRSYAIPTMFSSVNEIEPYVYDFIKYAKDNPDKEFLVTKIGCGIARFTEKDIAPLFSMALNVNNIVLPKTFVDILRW